MKCRKCKSEAIRIHSPEQVNKDYKDNPMMQYELLRMYKCTNKECSYIWQVSQTEIFNAFQRKIRSEGLSALDKKKFNDTVEKIKEIKENEKDG